MVDTIQITQTGAIADTNPAHPILNFFEGDIISKDTHPKATDHQFRRILELGFGKIVDAAKEVMTPIIEKAEQVIKDESEQVKESVKTAVENKADDILASFKARIDNIITSLTDKKTINDKLEMIGLELGITINKNLKPETLSETLVNRFKEVNNV
jgi:hypothetical protein